MTTAFICIGAQKAGTTWLYEVLRGHEEIGLPPIKEVHYFDNLFLNEKHYANRVRALTRASQKYLNKLLQTGIDPHFAKGHALAEARRFQDLVDFFAIRSDDDYLRYLMKYAMGKSAYGEITPSYALLPREGFSRIHQLIPNVKIIYIMRDPVSRCWSQIKMDASRTGRPAAELASRKLGRIGKWPDRSDYKTTIERLQQSGIENAKFFLFEAAFADKHGFVRDVLEYLAVTPTLNRSMIATIERHVHQGSAESPPAGFVRRMREEYEPVRRFVHDLGFDVARYWGW
jgi:sulfotransferase family protein